MTPGRPPKTPLGLQLSRTARTATQAFDRAMADAGGSASTWQVLLLVRSQAWGNQARLAEAMGITSATLTHHLNALEADGLVRRWREPDNRRVQHVELTPEGATLFDKLRRVAVRQDRRLRAVLGEEDADRLADLLDRLGRGLRAEHACGAGGEGP
jgi:MarR family transcriptional regulator, transcriptional regulator for hemolysin